MTHHGSRRTIPVPFEVCQRAAIDSPLPCPRRVPLSTGESDIVIAPRGVDAVRRTTPGSQAQTRRMLGGLPYDPRDPVLARARLRARKLTHEYNRSAPDAAALRAKLLQRLLGACGAAAVVEPPFFCDYGRHIEFGDHVFLNMQCVILDCARVALGARTLLGPAVMLLTATHPLVAADRRTGAESALPIDIGDDVWLGAGVIVCPGVSIGARTVVGAGSVVTRDLPADVVAAGNPCRVLRPLVRPRRPPASVSVRSR